MFVNIIFFSPLQIRWVWNCSVLYHYTANLWWLWMLPLFSIRYKEGVFGILLLVPLHCKYMIVRILMQLFPVTKKVCLELFRLYRYSANLWWLWILPLFFVCKKKNSCIWNCLVCSAALQIYDGLNFTAFLCSLQTRWIWNCSVVPLYTLQTFDGCEFYRFSPFAKNKVCLELFSHWSM